MIDYSLIEIITADESHREFGYQVKKAAEGKYIAGIWGWDEDVQRGFHSKDWQHNRPEVITYGGEPIGTIYISEDGGFIEINQFFIMPEYQNKGIGTNILRNILDKADRSGLKMKLKYLRNNPVESLYKRNDFMITGFDGAYYSMEREPVSGNKKGGKSTYELRGLSL